MGKRLLTNEQKEIFIREYPNKTNRELEKMFNIPYQQILSLSRTLRGLKKTKECLKRCRVCNEEHIKNLSLSHTGYIMPEEQKRKISESNIGRKATEETRKRLSISKMGDKNPMKRKEVSSKVSKALTGVKFSDIRKAGLRHNIETNPNYGMTGKHHTKESMEKRFNTMKERNSFTRMFGDKNPSKRPEVREKISNANRLEKSSRWLGGKSFEPYGLDFNKKIKKVIKERDGCCLMCNICFEDLKLLKKRIHIHHIDYDKQNNFMQNFASLCVSCHMKTNINRSHWTKFFQSLLAERYGYKYSEDGKIILNLQDVKQ